VDPNEFMMVIGAAVFAANCVLRYMVGKQSTRAHASLEASLKHEMHRFEEELARVVNPYDAPPGDGAAAKARAAADVSRAAVDELIVAERDARRAQRTVHHLDCHEMTMQRSLDDSRLPRLRLPWFLLGATAVSAALGSVLAAVKMLAR